MAVTESGASADFLTVDPTSKAGRSTLYGPDGTIMTPGADGYIQRLDFGVFAAGAPANGSSIFNMRNATTSTRVGLVRKIRLTWMVTTAGTGTEWAYELVRTSAAAMSGGTAVTTANMGRKDTGVSNPEIASDTTGGDFRFSNAALTTTSVTFGQSLGGFVLANPIGSILEKIFDFDNNEGPIKLRAGEGLALRVKTITATIVYAMSGNVQFEMR